MANDLTAVKDEDLLAQVKARMDQRHAGGLEFEDDGTPLVTIVLGRVDGKNIQVGRYRLTIHQAQRLQEELHNTDKWQAMPDGGAANRIARRRARRAV